MGGRKYIWTGSELRKPSDDEDAELKKLAPASDLKPGDSAYITIPREHFQKFLDGQKLRESFAQKLGIVFMEWIVCCDIVLDIFISLTGLDEEAAGAIFQRVRSDRTQREITLDMAKIRLSGKTAVLAKLRKSFKELGELASERNVAAHQSFSLHFDKNWDSKMRAPSEHPWRQSDDAEERIENLGQKLNACGETLFKLLVQINGELHKRSPDHE